MFFTKSASLVAWLCLIGAVLHFVYLQAYSAQNGGIMPGDPKWQSLTMATSKDFLIAGVGIGIGVLAEISKSLARLAWAREG